MSDFEAPKKQSARPAAQQEVRRELPSAPASLHLKHALRGQSYQEGYESLRFKGGGRATSDPVGVAQQGFAGGGGSIPYKSEMEGLFGADFSQVRAHTGPQAKAASASLGAEAYAYGNNVAFSSANPDKGTVAHELTHVVQQGQGVRGAGTGEKNDAERQAEQVESAVRGGQSVQGLLGAHTPAQPSVQRSGNLAAHNQLIDDWYFASANFVDATRAWNQANWTRFFTQTGGDYYLAWTSGQLEQVITNVLVNTTASFVALGATTALGAALGTAVCPLVGTLIGAAIGIIIGAVVNMFQTINANNQAMETMHNVLADVGTQILGRFGTFEEQATQGKARLWQERQQAIGWAQKNQGNAGLMAQRAEFLRNDTLGARTRAPQASNMGLFNQMIGAWTQQRAASPTSARSGTNAASWRAHTGGDIDQADPNGKMMFVEQTAFEWSKTSLRNRDSKITAMRNDSAGKSYTQIFNTWNNAQHYFQGAEDVPKFIQYINRAHFLASVSGKGTESLNGARVPVYCTLILKKDDTRRVTYVDKWRWHIPFSNVTYSAWWDWADNCDANFDISP